MNECDSGRNPCVNGGTCSNTVGNYSCACPNGYRGRNCDGMCAKFGCVTHIHIRAVWTLLRALCDVVLRFQKKTSVCWVLVETLVATAALVWLTPSPATRAAVLRHSVERIAKVWWCYSLVLKAKTKCWVNWTLLVKKVLFHYDKYAVVFVEENQNRIVFFFFFEKI